MGPGDEETKSADVEIFLEDGPDPKAFVPSSSSFFKQTEENVNTALLDLLEDAFGRSDSDPAALAAPDDESAAVLRNHPWFHPPKREVFAAEDKQDSAFILTNPRQAFFRQAMLYAKQEGTPCDEVPFSSYFPNYGVMRPEQLGWYFYWRSNVRRNVFIRTDVSYIFLYFYELIHQVGFSSAEEALRQILFVWKEARAGNTVFDSYLSLWVRDFILYYGVEACYYDAVEEVLGEYAGRYLVQECILYFCSGEQKAGFLHALEALSDYPVTAGRYYRDGYRPLLESAVCRVFSLWDRRYKEKGHPGVLAALCGDIPLHSAIRPFESAYFYEHGQMAHSSGSTMNSGITVDFLPRTFESSLIPGLCDIRKVRRFITGLLRTVESNLRDLTGYRWSIQKGRLPKSQLSLMDKQCVLFYQEYLAEKKRSEKRIFHVDNHLLTRLKAESEEVREDLIRRQEQEEETLAGRMPAIAADEKMRAVPTESAGKGEEGFSGSVMVSSIEPSFSAASSFTELFRRFSTEQSAIVSLLLASASSAVSSASDFAGELGVIASAANTYPDVIIEEINCLSADWIGDCIIDSGGAFPALFPDYLDEIKEAMTHGGK